MNILKAGIEDLARRPQSAIPGLDALRTLAILLVFSDHFYFFYSQASHTELAIGRLPFFLFGWTGVDLFFVLSGLLIGGQLYKELSATGTVDMPRFVLRRGLRIWPYYFAVIALVLVFVPQATLRAVLPDIFFYSNYVGGKVSGGWSLSTEEQFYILVPLVLLLTVRILPFAYQWIPPALGLLLLPLARHQALIGVPVSQYASLSDFVIYAPFHTHADGLAAGLLLAWAGTAKRTWLASAPVQRNIVLPIFMLAAAVVIRMADKQLFSFTALALIYSAMVLLVLRDKSALSRILSGHALYLGSRLSYAMYLNHFLILRYILPVVIGSAPLKTASEVTFLIYYALMLFSSTGIAAVTFVAVESPFLRLRSRILSAWHH